MAGSIKQELRKMLLRRACVPSGAETMIVVAELKRVLQNLERGRTVLLYRAISAWGEFDISSLPETMPLLHFDQLENVKETVFPKKKYSAVVVPLLGFNAEGYRLGRGGGWYDVFLATQPQALKIGIGDEKSRVNFVPEGHDIPLDVIITQKRLRDFRP